MHDVPHGYVRSFLGGYVALGLFGAGWLVYRAVLWMMG